jgi:beta-lactamase class A
MHTRSKLLFYAVLTTSLPLIAQSPLQQELRQIEASSRGRLNIACSLPDMEIDCNLHPNAHAPMQSVLKLPLALTVLHFVDTGRFSLDQRLHFGAADIWPGTYSSLQDAHPAANVDFTLRNVLGATNSNSDNVGAELLVHLLGGTQPVLDYLASLGITQVRVLDGERALQRTWQEQYLNYAEPAQMVQLLRLLADHSPLSAASANFLDKAMLASSTGPHRMKGLLPASIAVAHKTGSSGTLQGLTAATNDVGLITLPGGRRLALALFLTDSTADEQTRDAALALASKAIYDAALAAAH